MDKNELEDIELSKTDQAKYSSFEKYTSRSSKYRKNRKKTKRFILWPFVIIIPLFLISLIIDNLIDSNEWEDNPKQTMGSKINQAISLVFGGSNSQNESTDASVPVVTDTLSELKNAIQTVFERMPHYPPQSIQDTILAQPDVFVQDIKRMLQLTPSDLLWLVDKQHPLQEDYVPNDLINLKEYTHEITINRDNLKLRKIAFDALRIMSNTAKKSGITLLVSSTYRSYEYQGIVFSRIVNQEGMEEAERTSARPGTSQHQLGTTIDFGTIDYRFDNTEASKWLKKNATIFGYSMSYPPNGESITGYVYESWHYRYIGIPAALFLDTYFEGYQQYMLEFLHYIPQDSMLYTQEYTANL